MPGKLWQYRDEGASFGRASPRPEAPGFRPRLSGRVHQLSAKGRHVRARRRVGPASFRRDSAPRGREKADAGRERKASPGAPRIIFRINWIVRASPPGERRRRRWLAPRAEKRNCHGWRKRESSSRTSTVPQHRSLSPPLGEKELLSMPYITIARR